jgi:hypothetical protein
MNRKVVITCAVLTIAVLICLGIAVIIGGVFFLRPAETRISIPEIEEIPFVSQDTAEPQPTEEASSILPGEKSEINPETVAEMEIIQRQVIRERGLEPSGVFSRTLLTKEQLRQRVIDDFLQDYSEEEAQEDSIVLEAFGLLNADFDMISFYRDLLSEQIAGFYDNETKEMVVVQGLQFAGPERLTYAHEYTHALQDQNFDIREGLDYSEESCKTDSERCAAIQALIEGDASLSEINWFMSYADTEDRSDIFDFYNEFEQPIMDSAPDFLSKDFLFPYEKGYTFVQNFFDRGGWDEVNQIYTNLPVSTEQILHPERYPQDKPIPIRMPDLSEVVGEGWTEIDSDVMGEWYTFLILAHGLEEDARVDEDEAAKAAEGWGGDAYSVIYNQETGDTVMVFRTLWETSIEAAEFVDAFKSYADSRFDQPEVQEPDYLMWVGNGEYHTLHIESVYTTWILSPDQASQELVWEAIQNQK